MLANDVNSQLNIHEATILVVDDEPFNLTLIDKMLSADGYQNIMTTEDPREVLGIYESVQIDLLLLDINMPHMDGFEVIELLKEKFGDQLSPILVLTAQSLQEFRIKALRTGARDYVTKPFDRYELIARVRNLLELQLTNRHLCEQNDELESRVQSRTQELRDTQEHLMRRLIEAIEFRDNGSDIHTQCVGRVSQLLGKAIGLSDNEADLLLRASQLHDLGKIGVPEPILTKPGPLNDQEWEVMKSHVKIGADILNGIDSVFMHTANDIALNHHEKWDGSGYPRGLSGKQIPIFAQIVAVADVFDSLMSPRTYRDAWPIEKAIEYIKGQSGKHFQPELVDKFSENIDEIIKIEKKYRKPD